MVVVVRQEEEEARAAGLQTRADFHFAPAPRSLFVLPPSSFLLHTRGRARLDMAPMLARAMHSTLVRVVRGAPRRRLTTPGLSDQDDEIGDPRPRVDRRLAQSW